MMKPLQQFTLGVGIGLCALLASAEGPKRFSVNVHNAGFNPLRHEALSSIKDDVDMVRTNNVIKYSGRNNQENLNAIVVEDDRQIDAIAKDFSWNRILLLINDKIDNHKPTLEETVNAQETGFAQRTVRAFPYIEYVQFFNETCNFDFLCGDAYAAYFERFAVWVHEKENPRRQRINDDNKDVPEYVPLPMVKVVSAAMHGQSLGIPEMYKILPVLFEHADAIAVHDYTPGGVNVHMLSLIRKELGRTDMPIWVTETGSSTWENHPKWYLETLTQMEEDLEDGYTGDMPQHIFWYRKKQGPIQEAVPGLNQYGLFYDDEVNWYPTNPIMYEMIKNRNTYVREEEPQEQPSPIRIITNSRRIIAHPKPKP